MLELQRNIERVAPSRATVLLTGETGTGKDVVARAIHAIGPTAKGAFIALNCGAVSASIIESELFGHEPGSFTGAVRRHAGVFEQADKGTLFLDEIGEMPKDLQVKLLRVLESGSFRRVGGERQVTTDARIVAATNRSLETALRDGRLREDLYFRLRVFPIAVPPLRDRGADIGLLAQHFLDDLNTQADSAKQFTGEAMQRLQRHTWPGNVRELKNLVHHAFLLSERRIDAEAIRFTGQPMRQSSRIEIEVGSSIAAAERALILATMDRFDGNKSKVAQTLGVSLKTLYTRLNLYQAMVPDSI